LKTPGNAIGLVLLASFIGSFGAVLLKAGANQLEFNLRSLATNYRLMAGIAFFLFSTFFFVRGVSQPGAELTVLYPMVSLSYIWTLLWSRLFFGEPFTKTKLQGLLLILAGIIVLQFGR
jgi:multidrug transporter EmrE-like cation transporter